MPERVYACGTVHDTLIRGCLSEHTLAPWHLFVPHRTRPWPFFLDHAATVSFAGSLPASQIIVDHHGSARVWRDGRWEARDEHPLEALASFVESSAARVRGAPTKLATAALPRTVGYLAYELGAFVEDVAIVGPDPAGMPLAVLSTYDRIDAWAPGWEMPVTLEFDGAARRQTSLPPPLCCPPMASVLPEAAALAHYRRAFERISSAIRDGEIYQANLSRRMDLPFDEDPTAAYRRLRRVQPVPQGAYLDFGSRQVLSNSPECFLRIHGDTIETFPIKGTRARLANTRSDRAAIAHLASDAKERAEHVMIVDLERNDLGRICRAGTVEVPVHASVESFATVHHLVSTVRGTLRPDVSLAALLRATFPGGSITGAPKIRAMEIIAEVEPQARGIYTGAIGALNGGRSLELAIAIRTALVGAGRVHYCVGGGIVADSRWQAEYEETNVKARAFLDSLRIVPDARAAS